MKMRGDQDLRRPAAVAEREVVGDDRDQPLARAVDDARGDHAGRVAAEAHHHGQRLFAVRAALFEQAVQVEGHARQVAEVLQQREQREEDRHRRQHHADHPGGGQIHAVDQQPAQPPGQPKPAASRRAASG